MRNNMAAIIATYMMMMACYPCYRRHIFAPNHTYAFQETSIRTPGGILVDVSGRNYPLEEIDMRVRSLEECTETTLNRGCIKVKIATDYTISPCTGERILSIPAGIAERRGAEEKIKAGSLRLLPTSPCQVDQERGLLLDSDGHDCEECPPGWRAHVEGESFIVTEPSLVDFTARVAQLVWGGDPWKNPRFKGCLNTGRVDVASLPDWQ